MEKKLTTDVDIINEYSRLHAELGTTQKCCNAVLDLSENKPEPWKSILKGLVYLLKGDGIEITDQSYKGEKEYKKAYAIFDKVQKQIKDKKGLLYLFVEINRIDALALCFTKPIKQIESLYDDLINKFKDDETSAIQAGVAKAMLCKSFVLGKYSELAESEEYKKEYCILFNKSIAEADKIITTFDTSQYIDNPYIQTTIAKAISNKASDMKVRSDEYKKDSLEMQKKIIEKYRESDDNNLRIQVSRAMFQIAMDLHAEKVIKEAEEKNEISYSTEKEITSKEVLEKYDESINKFKDIPVFDIQKNVLFAMLQKAKIYRHDEEFELLIVLYDEIIENFKNEEGEFFKWNIAFTMKDKIEILRKMDKLEDALGQCDVFLEQFSSNDVIVIGSCIAEIKAEIEKKLKEDEEKRKLTKRWEEIIAEEERVKEQIRLLVNFYPNNEKHLKQLIELNNKQQIIPYIGAGLSYFKVDEKFAYPLWGGFMDEVYKRYRQFKDGDERKRLIEGVVPLFADKSCIAKASFLKERLGQALFGMEIRDTFTHKTIGEIGSYLEKQPHVLLPDVFKNRIILTTNFDNLIELAYQKKDTPLYPCSVSDINKMDDINSNVTILYKLHGTIDEPSSIILTQDDYKRHYDPMRDDGHCRVLSKYLSGNRVLFMGCSLVEDEEIMPFYKKSINYALFPCTYEKREETEHRLSEKNIIPILFPEDQFHYIVSILKHCWFESNEMKGMVPMIRTSLNTPFFFDILKEKSGNQL